MRKTIFSWLGREFVSVSGEARPQASVVEETNELFQRFERELRESGLSLENTVRTRIWAADREARNLATVARSKILTGRSKAASSSYIFANHFDSGAKVALDLLAMRPSRPGAERQIVEFEPPRNYLCHLRYDSVVFVSGFTSEADRLEDQVPEVLAALGDALKNASSSWAQVVKLSIFLSKTEKLDFLKALLAKANALELPKMQFAFVNGFSREPSLLEAEATALVNA